MNAYGLFIRALNLTPKRKPLFHFPNSSLFCLYTLCITTISQSFTNPISMAVITEEESDPLNKKPTTAPSPPKPTSSSPNPFAFWFYFTLTVSLLTLLFVFISYLSPQDPKTWFISLPNNLRDHYSKGRSIKVQISSNHPTIEVFSIQDGPILNSDNVLILHGLGCSSYNFRKLIESLAIKGLHTVAIDLPGSGFSDKSITVVEETGGIRTIWDIYNDIKEKGLFWGFDQLVEQGYVNFDDPKENRVYTRERLNPIELNSEQMGRVLGQVIGSLKLSPVDLVLHDSALVLCANWISENPGLVRSITLMDTPSDAEPALPLWSLQVPVVREVVLGLTSAFGEVIKSCCWKSVNGLDLEASRLLLKGMGGRKSVVGMGRGLNCSFDLIKWSGSESVKGLAFQVIWSKSFSGKWLEEGKRVASGLPLVPFVTHSGGRWPQDDNADELAETIYGFLSGLPKPDKEEIEEVLVEKSYDEGNGNYHHHHDEHVHDEHGHGHGHGHGGFMDAYGLGHAWGS